MWVSLLSVQLAIHWSCFGIAMNTCLISESFHTIPPPLCSYGNTCILSGLECGGEIPNGAAFASQLGQVVTAMYSHHHCLLLLLLLLLYTILPLHAPLRLHNSAYKLDISLASPSRNRGPSHHFFQLALLLPGRPG